MECTVCTVPVVGVGVLLCWLYGLTIMVILRLYRCVHVCVCKSA